MLPSSSTAPAPGFEKNNFCPIVYKFVIAELSEKVKFKFLASNAKKLWSIDYDFLWHQMW